MDTLRHSPGSNFVSDLRGFGPSGILAFLVIIFTGNIIFPNMIALPLGGLLVLLWVKLSNTPWQDIGYARPKNWIVTITTGLASGIILKFVMKAFVMPMFGADPINQSYHFLAGNKAILPAVVWTMLAAGFGEETVFRGYLFERFKKLFGSNAYSKTFIVFLTSIWFGLSHYYSQGFAGVEQAIVTGFVFGIIYMITEKIWVVMIAHAAFDLTALFIIYYNYETKVAHLIFK